MCSFKHIPSDKSFFIHESSATHPVFSVMMPHLFEEPEELIPESTKTVPGLETIQKVTVASEATEKQLEQQKA